MFGLHWQHFPSKLCNCCQEEYLFSCSFVHSSDTYWCYSWFKIMTTYWLGWFHRPVVVSACVDQMLKLLYLFSMTSSKILSFPSLMKVDGEPYYCLQYFPFKWLKAFSAIGAVRKQISSVYTVVEGYKCNTDHRRRVKTSDSLWSSLAFLLLASKLWNFSLRTVTSGGQLES